MRRSTVLSLPPRLVFPACTINNISVGNLMIGGCHATQHNDIQHIFSIMTFRIAAFSLNSLFATLSINNTQHNIVLNVVLLTKSNFKQ